MPVYQELVNFNEMYLQLRDPPIIINDISNETENDRDFISDLITTRYTSDMISLLPSCKCGKTKGEFSLEVECPYCRSIVTSVIQDAVEPTVWFRKPVGVAPLMSPIIWHMLNKRLTKSSFSALLWLTDTTYRPVRNSKEVQKMIASGLQRGYNNFYENFDTIIDYLFSSKMFPVKRDEDDILYKLIKAYRDRIFSDYLPLPTKALLVIEETNVGKYIDQYVVDARDAINMLISIDRSFYNQNAKVKENRTVRALTKLTDFYVNYFKNSVNSKLGQFRRHIFGSRTDYSNRAVISSITDTYRYDEIHLSWGAGLSLLEQHIKSKLLKLGMDSNSANGQISGHINKYSPMLDSIMKEIINESRDKKLYCILQRNPSLQQGSAQRVGITKIKTDPRDQTTSMNILIVKAMNADFDGDALNISLATDNTMADGWYSLHPKFSVLCADVPNEVSNNVFLPKPIISTIANWLEWKY